MYRRSSQQQLSMEATGRYHEDNSEEQHGEEELHDDSREPRLSSMDLPLRRRLSYLPGSYLHEQGNGSSSYTSNTSSSGTIVSTAYTSRGSHLSSLSTMSMSAEAAMRFDSDFDGVDKEQIKRIMSLVQEFSIPAGGDMSALAVERWLVDLDVVWVLHLGDGGATSAAGKLALAFSNAPRWLHALAGITKAVSLMVNPKTISLMRSLRPDPDHSGGSVADMPSICEEEPETENGKQEATAAVAVPPDRFQIAQFVYKAMMKMVGLVLVTAEDNDNNRASSIQFQHQFAHFIRETILKMLAFVDVVFVPAVETTARDLVGNDLPYYKHWLINTLLRVRDALSSALTKIQLSFLSQPSADAEAKRIQSGIVSLLSAADSKADEAVWTRMEEARAGLLELLMIRDDEDGALSGTLTWQGSSDIHRSSWHVMGFVAFIQRHYNALHTIASKAANLSKYVPRFRDAAPLDSLQMEMVSCLQEHLAKKSELFKDQALRFLFLINNLHFILVNLTSDSHFTRCGFRFNSIDAATSQKPGSIEEPTIRLLSGYLKSYIQVSWEPLLACLSNATPPCIRRHYSRSQLSKFESEYQKTYTAQKQWKVPDPTMRKMLRTEITRRIIIPGYTKYIEDNKITNPKFSTQDLEHMLEQLFEG